jgi:ADP-heptose:LPS heptosyltransferase
MAVKQRALHGAARERSAGFAGAEAGQRRLDGAARERSAGFAGAEAGNVLVLRALGLGDLLTAVPALGGLREAFPDAALTLACPAWLHELVHEWRLADETADVGPLEPLPAALREPELAVNLHGRGPESTRLLLAAQPRRLLAFRHPAVPETRGLPAFRMHEWEVARWCRLLSESGIPASPDRLDVAPPADGRLAGYEGCTVVHPGASAPARRWPAKRWALVTGVERSAGFRVVLTGTRQERAACVHIARAAGVPEEDVLAGCTTPLELAALVGRAALVVCGDTGVAHLATALRTPSVVLFGPVSPAEWGPPPGRRELHRALWTGRRGDPHALATDPALLELSPERVLLEIEDLRLRTAPGTLVSGRVASGSV